MRFWDASAIFPLLVEEPSSAEIVQIYREDPGVVAWCLTGVEVWSAVTRRRREGRLRSPEIRLLRQRLTDSVQSWSHVQDITAVRARALRVLDVHPLRAADALQLGAALVFANDRPVDCPFVTLDDTLAEAAEIEGFPVLPRAPS
jgi:hypothetical protein